MDIRILNLLFPVCSKLFKYKATSLATLVHPFIDYPEYMVINTLAFYVYHYVTNYKILVQ